MNINWNEMPDWADVWIESRSGNIKAEWYKDDKNRWVQKDGMFWSKEDNAKSKYIVHYPPETKPQWRSPEDGLPPVGIEVEVNHHEYGWTPADTIGPYGDYMVCSPNGGGFYGYDLHEIRPKKSDKEKWVDHVMEIYHANNSVSVPDTMGDIYEALASGELPIPKGANND